MSGTSWRWESDNADYRLLSSSILCTATPLAKLQQLVSSVPKHLRNAIKRRCDPVVNLPLSQILWCFDCIFRKCFFGFFFFHCLCLYSRLPFMLNHLSHLFILLLFFYFYILLCCFKNAPQGNLGGTAFQCADAKYMFILKKLKKKMFVKMSCCWNVFVFNLT